ncbi:MAG: DUF523 domain-containing protein [Longicatena sp.]
MKYAISSCLMGINCKYNGGNNYSEKLVEFMRDKEYIVVCPEVLGGLSTPRKSSERLDDKIKNMIGEDVSDAFYEGAKLAIQQIEEFGADLVISQVRSPSCGKGLVYDGSFQNKLISGNGVFVEMLIEHKIPVQSIDEFLSEVYKYTTKV